MRSLNSYPIFSCIQGAGPFARVTYGGLGQVLPQDAYALQGTAFNLTVLRRF